MTLFEECLEALGENAKISEKITVDKVLNSFDKHFPLTTWGRIDWKKVKDECTVLSPEEIIPTLKSRNKDPFHLMYVIGGNAKMPVLESKLDKALEVLDDIVAISHITWFFCPSEGWIVQINDDDTITIGFAN